MYSNDEQNIRLQRIEEQLKELVTWFKFSNRCAIREILAKELDTEEKKKIYQLTDGTHSQYDIEGLTKVTRRMVGYYWQKWLALGILAPSEQRKGRMRKIIDLEEIGINIAAVNDKDKIESISVAFEYRNLEEILHNSKLFPSNDQLIEFCSPILNFSFSSEVDRVRLINEIITAFEKADKLKQNLFLQALERRARERQTTEFSKFFDAWARQIGK